MNQTNGKGNILEPSRYTTGHLAQKAACSESTARLIASRMFGERVSGVSQDSAGRYLFSAAAVERFIERIQQQRAAGRRVG